MFKKIIQSKIFTICVSVAVFFLFVSVFNAEHSLGILALEISNLKNKIDEVGEKSKKMEQEKVYFESEAYLERQARIKLNYKNPDEEAVLIYKTQSPSPSTGVISNVDNESASILDKIMNWFANLF